MSSPTPESPEHKPPPFNSPEGEPAKKGKRAPPEPGDVQGLKRFIKDARQKAKGGGDVNVANIGESAQIDQIAVGRNILQAKIHIGALVLPVRFLLALIAVAAVLAIAVWWIATPGQMSQGSAVSNVAIVEFGAQDKSGKLTNSIQGAYLAKWLYNRLNSELNALPISARPSFWHLATSFDPLYLFQKRTTAPVQNEMDAKRVADQVGARIVIYGNLVPGQTTEAFVPQFYIEQKKGEADELSGTQQLGQPIPIPTPVNDEYLTTKLQPIGEALVWFSRGLQNDINGRFDLAYQILKQGEQDLTNWDEDQGKEVLYCFIGREALLLSQCERDARIVFDPEENTSGVERALIEAENYFARAQQIAQRSGRTYARATFGLAQVAFQRAQRKVIPPTTVTAGQCRINVPPIGTPLTCPAPPKPITDKETLSTARELMMQAISLFDQAEMEMPQPAPALLHTKIRASRATAFTFLARLEFLEATGVEAEPFLGQAIDTLQPLLKTTAAEDRRSIANIHFALGNAQFYSANVQHARRDLNASKAQVQVAITSFDACVKMIPTDEVDVFLRAILLPNCLCRRADAQKMLEGLE